MVNQKIADYIMKEESQGYTGRQLAQALIQQGYSAAEVNEAINFAHQKKRPKMASPKKMPKISRSIKKRNPFLVLIFCFITLGIYMIYWLVSTTNELRSNTKSAPNPWLLLAIIIPFVNMIVLIWYYWKYSKALNELTGFSTGILFILWLLFSPGAIIISQIELNKKASP